jgi:hypothetical protein
MQDAKGSIFSQAFHDGAYYDMCCADKPCRHECNEDDPCCWCVGRGGCEAPAPHTVPYSPAIITMGYGSDIDYCTDASDLGFPVGEWPEYLWITSPPMSMKPDVMGVASFKRIGRLAEGDRAGYVYRNEASGTVLAVLND